MSQREESCGGGTVADLHSALEGEGGGAREREREELLRCGLPERGQTSRWTGR